jgi:hypothetical protein
VERIEAKVNELMAVQRQQASPSLVQEGSHAP